MVAFRRFWISLGDHQWGAGSFEGWVLFQLDILLIVRGSQQIPLSICVMIRDIVVIQDISLALWDSTRGKGVYYCQWTFVESMWPQRFFSYIHSSYMRHIIEIESLLTRMFWQIPLRSSLCWLVCPDRCFDQSVEGMMCEIWGEVYVTSRLCYEIEYVVDRSSERTLSFRGSGLWGFICPLYTLDLIVTTYLDWVDHLLSGIFPS